MVRKKLFLVAGLAGSMLFSGIVNATSMRCGTHLISADQRHKGGKYEVLKKCGEPTMRLGNTWIYDKGGKTREVKFNDEGVITNIIQ